MATKTMPLTKVRANLSSIVRSVEDNGDSYIICRNNVPVAKIVGVSGSGKTPAGMLSAYADPMRADLEDGAMGRAMEAKHAADR